MITKETTEMLKKSLFYSDFTGKEYPIFPETNPSQVCLDCHNLEHISCFWNSDPFFRRLMLLACLEANACLAQFLIPQTKKQTKRAIKGQIFCLLDLYYEENKQKCSGFDHRIVSEFNFHTYESHMNTLSPTELQEKLHFFLLKRLPFLYFQDFTQKSAYYLEHQWENYEKYVCLLLESFVFYTSTPFHHFIGFPSELSLATNRQKESCWASLSNPKAENLDLNSALLDDEEDFVEPTSLFNLYVKDLRKFLYICVEQQEAFFFHWSHSDQQSLAESKEELSALSALWEDARSQDEEETEIMDALFGDLPF